MKAKLRNAVRLFWMYFLYGSGVLWWVKRRLASRGGIIVLTFHRVLPENEYSRSCSPHGMVVREQTFERLARHVAGRYESLRLSDTKAASQKSRNLRLVFTFDDGWADNARNAFPVTHKYGIPLTIFICPGRIGKQLPFWPERFMALWRAAELSEEASQRLFALLTEVRGAQVAFHPNGKARVDWALETLKRMPRERREELLQQMEQAIRPTALTAERDCTDATMTWNDIAALAEGGVTFGSHGQSHEILPQIPPAEAQLELSESKRAIEERLQKDCRLLSYPNGDSSDSVRELAAQTGYELAFLNQPGIWMDDTDHLSIPRINVWEGKLIGPSGTFSPVVFEYSVFWKAYLAGKPALS
jgi:peptidoglycan/xylan/chitin deacetylase (PgdA/CDA1 family)